MKRMKTVLIMLFAAVLIMSLAACADDAGVDAGVDAEADAGDQIFQIGIVQLMDHPALDSAREGFIAAFNHYGIRAEFDYQNAAGDHPTLNTIATRFVNNEVDLILAIATPSLTTMFNATDTIPIVGTAITSYETAGVVYSNEAPGTNVTGTSDMNPIKAQIDMIFEFVPHLETLGIVFASSEPNSVYQAGIAISYAESLGLAVRTGTVASPAEVQTNMLSVASAVDAIWIPTCNTHANAMILVGEIAMETGVPVFPGENNMVMGGGLATLSINYFELGFESGRMAREILLYGANPATMPIRFGMNLDLQYFINGFMAEELGIEIPARFADYVWFLKE